MTATADPVLPLLNLGAGENPSPVGVNLDFSMYYRLRALGLARLVPRLLVGAERWEKLRVPVPGLVCHDLRRPLPFADGSVAAVCHQHTLEHLDRPVGARLIRDVFRVLVPGGLHRICVPDLEGKIARYRMTLALARAGRVDPSEHARSIASIYRQSVRRESASTAKASRPRRLLENLVLGDARRRGESHQWMYDEVTLRAHLEAAGFTDIRRCEAGDSAIDGWPGLGLETGPDGRERAPGSLYMEARRPA